MGYRLIAMSMLPINKYTLVYGSADGGFSVFNHAKAAKKMKRCAQQLNLKESGWLSGGTPTSCRSLCAAVDIEVHRSNNSFYLLDFR